MPTSIWNSIVRDPGLCFAGSQLWNMTVPGKGHSESSTSTLLSMLLLSGLPLPQPQLLNQAARERVWGKMEGQSMTEQTSRTAGGPINHAREQGPWVEKNVQICFCLAQWTVHRNVIVAVPFAKDKSDLTALKWRRGGGLAFFGSREWLFINYFRPAGSPNFKLHIIIIWEAFKMLNT